MGGEITQSELLLPTGIYLVATPTRTSHILVWAKKADPATVFCGIVALFLTAPYRSWMGPWPRLPPQIVSHRSESQPEPERGGASRPHWAPSPELLLAPCGLSKFTRASGAH